MPAGTRLHDDEVKTRKSVFLREVVRHLALSMCSVETARFEQVLSRPALHLPSMSSPFGQLVPKRSNWGYLGDALRPGGQQLWFLSGAQPVPVVPFPLRVEREIPLVESLRSRLLVIRKDA